MEVARGAGLRAVVVGSMLCGTAALAAAFQEGVFVATTSSVNELSLALNDLGALPVANASAIAVGSDGRTWVLAGSRLRSYSPAGDLVSETLLPADDDEEDEDEEEGEEDEGDDDEGRGVLATLSDGGVAVARHRDVFFVSAAGDLLANLALPRNPVAAGSYGQRLWVAHEKGLVGFETATQVATISISKLSIEDMSVAPNGELWLALGKKELRVVSPMGVTLRSRAMHADGVSAASSGAWVSAGSNLVRVDGALQTIATAPALPNPSKIEALATDPRDGSVFAAAKKRIRHVGPAGELLGEKLFDGNAKVKAQHAVALRIDRVAPSLVFLSPLSGSCVRTPVFKVAVQDVGLGADMASLQFTTQYGSLPATCTFLDGLASCGPLLSLPDGAIVLSATIADLASVPNVSAAAVVAFEVDSSAPSIQLSAAPALTNVAQISLAGTVSEPATLTVNGDAVPVSDALTWRFTATLVEGANAFALVAEDCAQEGQLAFTVLLDTTAPEPPGEGLVTCSEAAGDLSDCIGDPGSVEGGSSVFLTNMRTGETTGPIVANADGSWGPVTLAALPGDVFSVYSVDPAGNVGGGASVFVPEAPGDQLPPDPATVAPPLDPTVATEFYSAVSFLWEGVPPIQTNVVGTIEPRRIVVIRGVVHARDGSPIPGVRVHAKNFPELGETRTRADGAYDLASHGGGEVVLRLEKQGFITVDRHLATPWRDYVTSPDVVMIPRDPGATVVELAPDTGMQVARASVASMDEDGSRRPTVLFTPGTVATLLFSDGHQEPLLSATLHLTEFTVGDTGRDAMPGELPPNSQYTFAFDAHVEEAGAASHVVFDRPVIGYVENFLSFPVGISVPSGIYDQDVAAWIPEADGLVIQIAGVTGGAAELIVDESSVPANELTLESLGITVAERKTLAGLYATGETLFRVPLSRFSTTDFNMPVSATEGPNQPPATGWNPPPGPCTSGHSIIECQSRTLGESIAITGTPWSLNYRSDRVPGRAAPRTLDIQLSGSTIPADLARIDVIVDVAGEQIRQVFPAQPNLRTQVTWSGRDGYGRVVQGEQRATVSIFYLYPTFYSLAAPVPFSFGLPGSGTRLPLTRVNHEGSATLQVYVVSAGGFDARAVGLGGWTLSPHHTFDPYVGQEYLGSGLTRRASSFAAEVVETVAGGGYGPPGDGMPATTPNLPATLDIAVAPDGSVYLANQGKTVFRVLPDGTLQRVLGGYNQPGRSGDGGPGSSARINLPSGLALGLDGSLYVADVFNHDVRRLWPDGHVSTVAGTGSPGFSGDGGPASSAQLYGPRDVAVAPDGSLYICDTFNNRIRRVGPDGIIHTIAGRNAYGYADAAHEENVLATTATLTGPTNVAVSRNGDLYIVDPDIFLRNRIRRVGTDGLISTVAGGVSGSSPGRCEGCLATSSFLAAVRGLAVGADGVVYFTEIPNAADFDAGTRIRKITADGRVYTITESNALTPNFLDYGTPAFRRDGTPLGSIYLGRLTDLTVAPDGALYFNDGSPFPELVRRSSAPFKGFASGDRIIGSESGATFDQFNARGRHLRTVDATTGVTLSSFGYDASGQLASIADRDGNVTAIERDASGRPTAIIAPGGQRTETALDANGFLAAVTSPAGETTTTVHSAGGLLESFTPPRGHSTMFTYDDRGDLVRDEDPAGGFTTLSRTGDDGSYTVTKSTAEGRTTMYGIVLSPSGDEHRQNTFPDGTVAAEARTSGQSRTVVRPNGMRWEGDRGADARFGMASSITRRSRSETPGGLVIATSHSREVTLAVPGDPTSVLGIDEASTVNGRTWTSHYSAGPPRRTTSTSPEGRTATSDLDNKGRVVRTQSATLAPVNLVYRADGLLESTVQGEFSDARAVSMTYNARRELASVTDPLGRTTSFERNAAGRVTRQVLPDGREILTTWDANGNVTSVTPPSRPEHRFTYTEVDLEETYDPPDVAGATPGVTSYEYDLDRRLLRAVRPDGATVNLSYHAAGQKLSQIAHAAATTSYSYDSGTGQLDSMSESGGSSLSYDYDGSLVLSETMTGPVSGQVSRAYDSDLRVREERVNGLSAVSVTYDGDSLPEQVGDLLLARNPATGLLSGTMLGSVATARTTNAFAEPIAESAHVGTTEVLGFEYDRDALGRITELRETIGGVETPRAFTYDSAGRLTDVSVGGFDVAHWAYDGNSNRTSATTALGTVTADYDDQDRLLRYGDATFTYTANGELATRTDLDGTTSYVYDALGNLRHVELADGRVIDYVIDARNRRVGKKIDGVLVQGWLFRDQLEPVAELDGAGNVVARFVYATKGHSPDYMIKDGATYRILSDHLGSPRMVIDVDSGAIVQEMDFDEWGVVLADTNPGWQPFGFAGGLWDADTGLVRFGARDYAGAEGRWTAKDPLKFGGGDSNLFGYVMDDPINGIDPSGKLLWVEVALEILFGAETASQEDDSLPQPEPEGPPIAPDPPAPAPAPLPPLPLRPDQCDPNQTCQTCTIECLQGPRWGMPQRGVSTRVIPNATKRDCWKAARLATEELGAGFNCTATCE